jgi:serine phosphatase RsbU (regulator of sigma subunit)
VGGDLYEVLATRHGVRIVIGDVRGHGLPAVATVAALVGCFREAAHDEPELPGLLRRLERSLNRHLLERSRDEPAGADSRAPSAGAGSDPYGPVTEDFVTLLLLQIDVGGELTAVNCGHPWPYRLDPDPVSGARSVPVSGPEPLPPLGLFPLPEEIAPVRCLPLEPGQALFLHTDGAEDARDASGEFFPLHCTLAFAAGDGARGDGIVPRSVVDEVHAALMRHTGGRLTDDVALMTVRNDGRPVPAQAARGHTAPERTVRSAAD